MAPVVIAAFPSQGIPRVFSLDLPWLGKPFVPLVCLLYTYFGSPLASLSLSPQSIRSPLQPHPPHHMHQGVMHSKKGGKENSESEIRGSQRDLRTKTLKIIVDRRGSSEHRVGDSRDETRDEKGTRVVK